MKLLIVTGKSGAGKTQTINILEDIGYYCIDNIPPQLILKVAELCMHNTNELNKVAVVSDIRGGALFDDFFKCLDELKNKGIDCKVLFITANNQELTRRYRESRRKHPLLEGEKLPVSALVKLEAEKLDDVLQKADFVVDTTYLKNAQLRTRIVELFLNNDYKAQLTVHCMSFGFKYGTPQESDLLFDVRCFPNPFYIEGLKDLTGLNEPIQDFVLGNGDMQDFLKKLFDMIDFLLPLYQKEGKNQLVIAVGCTGGKHRSIVVAQEIYKHVSSMGIPTTIIHKDLNKI